MDPPWIWLSSNSASLCWHHTHTCHVYAMDVHGHVEIRDGLHQKTWARGVGACERGLVFLGPRRVMSPRRLATRHEVDVCGPLHVIHTWRLVGVWIWTPAPLNFPYGPTTCLTFHVLFFSISAFFLSFSYFLSLK